MANPGWLEGLQRKTVCSILHIRPSVKATLPNPTCADCGSRNITADVNALVRVGFRDGEIVRHDVTVLTVQNLDSGSLICEGCGSENITLS